MNTEEVIRVLGIPEDLADALVAAGTSILSAAPELAKNASHDLDMYNWYRDNEYYGFPGWMTAIADTDDTPLAIFDVVQYPTAHVLDAVQFQPSGPSFETDDPLLLSFMAWSRGMDVITEDLIPVHHTGNGVLLGVLATLSGEYAFEVTEGSDDIMPETEIELPAFRAVFRGGKLAHQYMVLIHADLYISRTFGTIGVARH